MIKDASDIVGSDYIQSDKYLQDIVRDKRYWENKRQNIHQREKTMEQTIAKYESEVKELEPQGRDTQGEGTGRRTAAREQQED